MNLNLRTWVPLVISWVSKLVEIVQLHLRQTKYILDILHRRRMVGSKPYSDPCTSGCKLLTFSGEPLDDINEYRQIVGALQYCTLTRSDIAYTVNQLCQFLHAPTSEHWSAVKRVLRHLKGMVDRGIYFTRGTLDLRVFCDADCAGNPDDRRSTTGYCTFLGPCLLKNKLKNITKLKLLYIDNFRKRMIFLQ